MFIILPKDKKPSAAIRELRRRTKMANDELSKKIQDSEMKGLTGKTEVDGFTGGYGRLYD